jgi:hyperosmotically inducible periplasmic protein
MIRAAGLAAALVVAGTACGGGIRPYRAMARAATSEENPVAQIGDRRLELQVREVLLADGFVPGVTPHAYMGHVYLVGFVATDEQGERARAAVADVVGVRSVDGYLPLKASAPHGVTRSASDLRIEGEVKAAIGIDRDERVTRVTVDVLDGHVVLLGVVSTSDASAAVEATARKVSGVTRVTNFLLLPEAGYQRLRPGVL